MGVERSEKEFENFYEFYAHYLSAHKNRLNRRLHFIGNLFVMGILLLSVLSQKWILLLLVPVFGYGFSWAGHYFVEKNTPSSLRNPLYAFLADWVMFNDMIMGKIKF